MPDLSKHLTRAKQSLDRRQYDYVLEQMEECLDLDPSNLDVHKLLLDASRKKFKETGGKVGLFGTMSIPALSKDPHKQLLGVAKRLGKNPDNKLLVEMGDSAHKMALAGIKPMTDVAIYYYEGFLLSGMFNDKVLWTLAHIFLERSREKSDNALLDRAIKLLRDIEKANPNHPEAARTIKNWEAMRSMSQRTNTAGADFRGQLASDASSKKAEAMGRIIRTLDDAKEVLGYVEQDLAQTPGDKQLWVKKGDIHKRIGQLAEARAALLKAQAIDEHDFTIVMRLGDLELDEVRAKIAALTTAGQDAAEAKAELLRLEIAEYRKRVARQPTDMTHHYNLGVRLIQVGDIDGAAAEFQRTVGDPKVRQESHRYLGFCFTKKNLLDLACQQYTSYLSLVLDDQADKAKEVRYLRARAQEDQNKRDEAITDYQRIVAIDLSYKDAATRLNKLRGIG